METVWHNCMVAPHSGMQFRDAVLYANHVHTEYKVYKALAIFFLSSQQHSDQNPEGHSNVT